MAVDYTEKEREFLESLEPDTGRDLAAWMAAITATGLTDRNAIIDWLRAQGFLFAKASWLERIHHNGGRPIYLDPARIGIAPNGRAQPGQAQIGSGVPPGPMPDERLAPPPLPAAPTARPSSAPPTSTAPRPAVVPEPRPPEAAFSAPAPGPAATALEDLLAEAKAYRPLAQFVLREIEKVLPDVSFTPRPGYVSLVRGTEFGILTIAPKELRLALAFGARRAPAPFVAARFPKSHPAMPAAMTHMVVLTDARQVDAGLAAAVRDLALASR